MQHQLFIKFSSCLNLFVIFHHYFQTKDFLIGIKVILVQNKNHFLLGLETFSWFRYVENFHIQSFID